MMLVHNPDHQELSAIVYDSDLIGADKEVGRVHVPIRDLPPGEAVQEWYDIEPPSSERSRNAIGLGLAVSSLYLPHTISSHPDRIQI